MVGKENIKCINCGAPLHHNDNEFIKCEYCGCEYSNGYDIPIKGTASLESGIIELEINGEYKKFYVSEMEINPIFKDFSRHCKPAQPMCHKMVIKMIEM